jgi:hypothetical protein
MRETCNDNSLCNVEEDGTFDYGSVYDHVENASFKEARSWRVPTIDEIELLRERHTDFGYFWVTQNGELKAYDMWAKSTLGDIDLTNYRCLLRLIRDPVNDYIYANGAPGNKQAVISAEPDTRTLFGFLLRVPATLNGLQ